MKNYLSIAAGARYFKPCPEEELFERLPDAMAATASMFSQTLRQLMEAAYFWEDELRWAAEQYGATWNLSDSWGVFLRVQLPPDQGFGYVQDLYDRLAEKSGHQPGHSDYAEVRRRTWSFSGGTAAPRITLAAFFGGNSQICKVIEKPGTEYELVCSDGPRPQEAA